MYVKIGGIKRIQTKISFVCFSLFKQYRYRLLWVQERVWVRKVSRAPWLRLARSLRARRRAQARGWPLRACSRRRLQLRQRACLPSSFSSFLCLVLQAFRFCASLSGRCVARHCLHFNVWKKKIKEGERKRREGKEGNGNYLLALYSIGVAGSRRK